MEVYKYILDKVSSLVPSPDFSPKGPYRVVGLDRMEAFTGFTGRNRGTPYPTQNQAQRLMRELQPLIERYDCSINIETAEIISQNPRTGMVSWQLIVSPNEDQSISTFGSSLLSIAATFEDPGGFSIGSEDVDLQMFIPRFSQAIRTAVATHKHGKYPL